MLVTGFLFSLMVITMESIMACHSPGHNGFLPDNDLWIPPDYHNKSSKPDRITKEKFHAVLDRIEKIYQPVFKSKRAALKVYRRWEDGTVNAFAQRHGSGLRSISMYGGLARHETVTEDALALVSCHELGHHIGGLPRNTTSPRASWATNEGQSDYFATSKCLRKYMEQDDNIALVRKMKIPKVVRANCEKIFDNPEERAVCERSAMAGLSLAELFKALVRYKGDLRFEKPDKRKVYKTYDGHPAPQCRLDTYFQGALCYHRASDEVSDVDVNQNVCSRENSDEMGIRPLCWYRPEN